VALPPTSYTFAGKQLSGSPSNALFSSPGMLLSAECAVGGRASTAYTSVFDEEKTKWAPKGEEVSASAVSIFSSAGNILFFPWTYLPKNHPHEDARNVMLSDDRKTLYWNEGYASGRF
jgi:hypothetical protein